MTDKHATPETTLPEREQEILDTALLESDQLLARSLHDDDQRRRRRQLWLFSLVIGGIVMSALLIAILMGWLTFGQLQTAEAARPTVEQVAKAEAMSAEGWQLWKKQDYVDAAKNFEQSIKLNPKAANAWNGYGWALFNSGQRAKAIEAFQACVKIAPKHPAGLNGLGQVYLSQGELSKAEKYLKKAAPQAPAAWYGLARISLLNKEFKQAKTWAEKIVKQSPKDEVAQKMLVAAVTEKLDEELRRMIEPANTSKETPASKKKAEPHAEQSDSSADFKRGWIMFSKQNFATAERLFRRVLKNEPKNPHAMNGLGWSLLNQGKYDEAKPLLEKCLKIEKDHGGAMNGLALCLKADGKIDEAIEIWERGYAAAPGPNALAVGLASTYLEREEYAKAAKYYEVLVDSDASNKLYQNGLKNARAGLEKSKE